MSTPTLYALLKVAGLAYLAAVLLLSCVKGPKIVSRVKQWRRQREQERELWRHIAEMEEREAHYDRHEHCQRCDGEGEVDDPSSETGTRLCPAEVYALTRSGPLSWGVELTIETKEGGRLSAVWPLWALTQAGAKRRADRFAQRAQGWVGGRR